MGDTNWLDDVLSEFDVLNQQHPPRSELEILRIAVKYGGWYAAGPSSCSRCFGDRRIVVRYSDGWDGNDYDTCPDCKGNGRGKGLLHDLYEEYKERLELDALESMSQEEREERLELKRLQDKYT